MTEEREYRRNYTCPHCQAKTAMEMVKMYSEVKFVEDEHHSTEYGDVYEILKCLACAGVVFQSYFYSDAGPEPYSGHQILYPMTKVVPVGLPSAIQSEYEAASKVKRISSNAYGVLMRRILELVCIDRKAEGKSLHEGIQNLSAKGEIPPKLVEVAKSLKDLGNVGAHALIGNLTEVEVPILDDLCRAILEYVYSAPYLAQRAQESVKRLKL